MAETAETGRDALRKAGRIVVKVGTNTVTGESGRPDDEWLEDFAAQVKRVTGCEPGGGRGTCRREVIIVSSGAIGAGCARMGLDSRPEPLPERQAAAAVGQVSLMRAWERALEKAGLVTGQILLTKEGLNDRQQYLNARNTIHALLRYGVIPVVNENDSVSIDEIKIGDNDTLSAHVALLADADLLVILTDRDGLLDEDPRNGKGKRIPVVREINDRIRRVAGAREGSRFGIGGMATKLAAARIVTESGVSMVIAHGRRPGLLDDVLAGADVGTWFPPQVGRMRARKRWIAFTRDTSGGIVVDAGAADALVNHGRSLLAVGVVDVRGDFRPGDSVDIVGPGGETLARGLVNYDSAELRQIKGLRSNEVRLLLHDNVFDCVVHRDNLVLVERNPGRGG